MDLITLLVLLLVWHALADYPLQGDYLARMKNPNTPATAFDPPWWLFLGTHALLLTGSLWLALAEFLAHAAIDWAKCEGRISFVADQLLHVACKVAWALLLGLGLA
jgi:hypothetical protein